MNTRTISLRRMNLAIKGTKAATWDWNISTGEVEINERWAEITGYTNEDIEPVTEQSWGEFFNLDDHAPHGACAVLVISDDGTGMDGETLSKIFEPFFSSKGDKGTGLGLATVYGIVRQHGGIIHVYSEEGVGSTFRILLPISDKKSVSPQKPVEYFDLSGNETILIVEDSDEVREVSVIALKRFGYKVVEAACGSDALAIIRKSGDSIDLMLTDVIMPGISLEELCREALALVPGLKIIYMSGYSDDVIKRIKDSGTSIPFISKPFTLTDLAKIVRSVIDKEV